MMSLPPCALKADRSGLVESISSDTSRTRVEKSSGRYLRTSKSGSRAKICCMPPPPYTQEIPLFGKGGCAGGAAPSHHALHPPVGPKAGVASPETPHPGYSVMPLASGNEKR